MTEKGASLAHPVAPPSPLDPYRSITERNPIEDHFTDKHLRKHMRHVGLVSKTPDSKNKDPTSLVHDEYQIWNSGKERHKRFRQRFITTMVDTVQEVDRARQAEFRNQLELWDKMYSNRIQRIKAYDSRLERKYGLFVDREMKKELIRENLSRLPQIPSVSIPRFIPDFIPKRRPNRAKSSKPKDFSSTTLLRQYVNKRPSSLDEITERLTKLENDFSTFEGQDFYDCRADVDLIKTNLEMLTNDKNVAHNEMSKLKHEIEELQTDLNEVVKDQDMLKIIQLEHEQKLSQLTLHRNTPEPTETSVQDVNNYNENLKTIQNKQKEFDSSLRAITANMEIFQKTITAADNGIIELNNKITMQQQQLEQVINDNANALQHQITTLQEELKRIIPEEIQKVKREIAVLQDRVDNLEETINGVKLPHTKKKGPLPYVEKLAAVDLFEINWAKYRQENQVNIND